MFGNEINLKGHPINWYKRGGDDILLNPEQVPQIKKLGLNGWNYTGDSVVDSYGIGYAYAKIKTGYTMADVRKEWNDTPQNEIANWKMTYGAMLLVYDTGLWGNISIWRPDIKARLKLGFSSMFIFALIAASLYKK